MEHAENGDNGFDPISPEDLDRLPDALVAVDHSPENGHAAAHTRGYKWMRLGDARLAPPPRWLIPDVLPAAAFSLLVAPPKTGKTTFILAMLKSATTGAKLFGQPIPPFHTWLFSEQNESVMGGQLRRLDYDGNERVAYLGQNVPSKTGLEFAERLARDFVDAAVKPDLIVIDTLYRWLPFGDGVNDYAQSEAVLAPLVQAHAWMAEQNQVALLATHHDRKAGGNIVDGAIGSRSLAAIPDTIITLRKAEHPNQRKLSVTGRLACAEEPRTIELRMPEGIYTEVTSLDIKDTIMAAIDGETARATIRDEVSAVTDVTPKDYRAGVEGTGQGRLSCQDGRYEQDPVRVV